jgi:hypothetical protein
MRSSLIVVFTKFRNDEIQVPLAEDLEMAERF